MKLKRILIVFSVMLISFSFSSCTYIFGLIFPIDGIPWNFETVYFNIVNNSDSEFRLLVVGYVGNGDYSYENVSLENMEKIASNENSFTGIMRSKNDKKFTPIFYIYDESGNKVFSACGWPKEWKSSSPNSWQIPSTDYDVYGIGYVDSELNGNTNIYYVNKQGSLSNKFSVSYTCTINEDNTISFVLNE